MKSIGSGPDRFLRSPPHNKQMGEKSTIRGLELNKTTCHSPLLDKRLVIAILYPTWAHGMIVEPYLKVDYCTISVVFYTVFLLQLKYFHFSCILFRLNPNIQSTSPDFSPPNSRLISNFPYCTLISIKKRC